MAANHPEPSWLDRTATRVVNYLWRDGGSSLSKDPPYVLHDGPGGRLIGICFAWFTIAGVAYFAAGGVGWLFGRDWLFLT